MPYPKNRQERRKLNAKESEEMMQEAVGDVASAFLLCSINVLGKRGWNEDELQKFTLELVEEYNNMPKIDVYRANTYEQYGIDIQMT